MANFVLSNNFPENTTAYGSDVLANDNDIRDFVLGNCVQKDGSVVMTAQLDLAAGTPTSTGAVRRDYMETAVGGTWTVYTPTWTASSVNPTLGNGTLVGRYFKINKSYDINIQLVIGSTTNLGTGVWRFSLPDSFTAVSFLTIHTGLIVPASGARRLVAPYTGGVTYIEVGTDQGTGVVTNAVPLAWTTGDTMTLTLRNVEAV